MNVLIQLLLLNTPDGALADRLEATFAVDPAAAEEAIDLLFGDPRMHSAPTLLAASGEPSSLAFSDGEEPALIEVYAVPSAAGVALDLDIGRAVDGNLLHYHFDLVAPEGRYSAVSLGDLTVLVRPVVDPDAVDLEESGFDRGPDLRPRARRRAIDALLVD